MKFCLNCGRTTAGKPLFCQFCGRSYNVKLCPRHHVNPRYADVCSKCGSRDLSTPQPRLSFWWTVLAYALLILAGTFVAFASLWLAVRMLRNPAVQSSLIVFGLLVAILWALWAMLPDWFQKFIFRIVKRRGERHEQ